MIPSINFFVLSRFHSNHVYRKTDQKKQNKISNWYGSSNKHNLILGKVM